MPGEVCFYLKKYQHKKANNQSGECLIYLRYKYAGKVFTYSFGETIHPKNWNDKKQRVKSNIIATTKNQKQQLNDYLDQLKDIVETTQNTAKGGLTNNMLKAALDEYRNRNDVAENKELNKPTFYKLAQEFIDGQIMNKYGEKQSPNTIKAYKTVVNHLKEFEKQEKYSVDFETIDLIFYRKYICYLNGLGLGVNTRGKHIQVIKYIMEEAVNREYTTNLRFKNKKFQVRFIDVDSVYLTDADILKLYRHDLSANKRLEAARDLFIFGCYVGLRYSDYAAIKPENIFEGNNEDGQKEYYLKVKTQKTGETVVIPCNPIVIEIFDKYKHNPNRLPRSISNQKLNEYIKEAAEAAKLNEKGRLSSTPEVPLFKLISSHTARRSFATNLYLEGFPTYDLMKITGHRTEKNFLKYLKLGNEVSAKRLNDHMRKEWSKKLLRVA